jgi:hypothetical protein
MPQACTTCTLVGLLERLDHGRRARRTADHRAPHRREAQIVGLHVGQQALPYGGHAGRHGHALGFEEVVQRLSVKPRAGEYQLRTDHAGDVGNAPGIDMEHRHHRQDAVAGGTVQRIGQRGGKRVEQGGAMAVQRALGVAGGTGGVTQRGSRVLIELRPVEFRRAFGDQVFVAKQVGDRAAGGHVCRIGHRDEGLDGLDVGRDGFDDGKEGKVEEQDRVLGMVGQVNDLIRVQSRIDGVQHRAGARYRVVQLQVAVAVPRQGADAVGHFQPASGQCVRHSTCAPGQFPVSRAVQVALHPPRDDLLLRVVPLGVHQQRRDQQGHLHHQTQHGFLLVTRFPFGSHRQRMAGRGTPGRHCSIFDQGVLVTFTVARCPQVARYFGLG